VAGLGSCLFLTFAALWIGGHLDHPLGPSPDKQWMPLCALAAFVFFFAALAILGFG
jgi:hypothetical protein